MDELVTGATIVKMYESGKKFIVGRSGGLNGKKLQTDISTGGWRTFEYEVKHGTDIPTNSNWFTSIDFYNKVKNSSSANEVVVQSAQTPVLNYLITHSGTTQKTMTRKADNPWHFSHLGEVYFLDVAQNLGFGRTLEAPIKLVYIGKKGVPYAEKKRGRMVNPKWAVIQENGEEYKHNNNKNNMVERGLWNTSNCHCFYWDDIRKYFTGK
jgi:hypothetical protein